MTRMKSMEKKAAAPRPSPAMLSQPPAPSIMTATRLVRNRILHVVWGALNSTARQMLRVPLGWRTRKGNARATRLLWNDRSGGREAWLIEVSAPATELAAALSIVSVKTETDYFKYALRRIPAGGIFTDPDGSGNRVSVETMGTPVLLRHRRGHWKRYDLLGALWPQDAQEMLGDHIAGVDGYVATAFKAPDRFVVDEAVPVTARAFKWERRSVWGNPADARAEAIRAAISDASVGRTTSWRVVDIGNGAVRAEIRHRKKGLFCADFSPTEKPALTKLDVPSRSR